MYIRLPEAPKKKKAAFAPPTAHSHSRYLFLADERLVTIKSALVYRLPCFSMSHLPSVRFLDERHHFPYVSGNDEDLFRDDEPKVANLDGWMIAQSDRAREWYRFGSIPPQDTICKNCTHLVELRVGKCVRHSQSFSQLAASARSCEICYGLVGNLLVVIGKAQQEDKGRRGAVHAGSDWIDVYRNADCPNMDPRSLTARFKVMWKHWRGYEDDKPGKVVSGIFTVWKIGDARFQSLPLWTPSNPAGDDQRIAAIKARLKFCDSHHQCWSANAQVVPPARLLDIGLLHGAQSIRLIETNKISRTYACLSHCWGKAQPITTTIDTIQQRKAGISLSDLPQTFQHAVQVCRALDIRYLWIDSLCIIQNDYQDWEQESARMGEVYSNAYLTIAASSASDSSGGLFQPFIAPFLGKHYGMRTLRAHSKKHPSPLQTRGWTLQEELLSGRTIYFSRPQYRWRCKERHVSEDGLVDHTHHVTHDLTIRSIYRMSRRPSYEGRGWWRDMCEQYSNRDLTHASDKLPALAGISNFAPRWLNRGSPVLGTLYNPSEPEVFLEGLLWKAVVDPAAETRQARHLGIPTWSWMSMTGRITYHTDTPNAFGLVILGPNRQAEVTRLEVAWAGAAMTSALRASILTLRGRLASFRLRGVDEIVSAGGSNIGNTHHSEAQIGRCYLDTDRLESADSTAVRCFEITHYEPFNDPDTGSRPGYHDALVLSSQLLGEHLYCRIGLAKLRVPDGSTDCFANAPEVEIRLA